MDFIKGLQSAIDYIEDNLTEEIDYEKNAKKAACSTFYFQRIFSALCDMSIGDYIRKRRLTLAGRDLNVSKEKVIDVALKYGYESPESFARAFSKFHGITPSEAKLDGSKLKSFTRLSVQIIMKGGNAMDYKVEEKQAFKVLEKVETHRIVNEENFNTIPDFWARSHQDGTIGTLLKLTNDNSYIFGICYGNYPHNANEFEYGIGAKCDDDCVTPEGFRINEIPARTWLVFDIVGAMPNAVQDLWRKITSEFFPTSDYEPTYEMDIEAYTAGVMTDPSYKSEIWVPVVKK